MKIEDLFKIFQIHVIQIWACITCIQDFNIVWYDLLQYSATEL